MATQIARDTDSTFDLNTLDPSAVATSRRSPGNPLRRLSAWYLAKVEAERNAEIVAFIAQRGGQFNDDMERELSRRFGGTAF